MPSATRRRHSALRTPHSALRRHSRSRRLLLESLENRSLLAGEVFPNDPLFSTQWALHNTGQFGTPDADIDAPEAWSVTTGSMATVVAILDAGVDYTHPDLYLNMWLNPGEIPGNLAPLLTDSDNDGLITFRDLNAPANAVYVADFNGNSYIDGGDLLSDPAWENGLDEDGNGYTDDLVGWDFHDNDNDPQVTVDAHGTDKSLMIGGIANNGIGGAGIVWSVRMIPIRIKSIGGEQGDLVNGNAAAGLDYGVAADAPISYQGYRGNPPESSDVFSQEIYDAIDRARQAGQLVVTGAGNSSRDSDAHPHYPGSYDLDNIISAAALDENNLLSSITNWGATTVDLGVPSYGGATSNSLAFTTGVAALLQSAHPDWTYTQIKDRILATVDPLPSLAGKSVTGGRLNAANALGVAQFSISDATASEGGNPTAFTSSNISVLENSADVAFGPSRNGDATLDLYVIGRFSDNIVVYDGNTGGFIEELVGAESGLDGPAWIAIGPDGDVFTSTITASGKRDGILRIDQVTKNPSMFLVDGSLLGAKGMAFGADGNFYLADTFNDRIVKYDGATGAFLGNFVAGGVGGLDEPSGILFGHDRNSDGVSDLYVSSFQTDSVLVFSGADGTSLGAFVAPGTGGLDGPHDMEFGPDGHLYVVYSGTSNEQVYRFDGATGAFLDIVIPSVEPETSFITFDRQGNLYVSSERTHDVLRYSAGPLVTLSTPSGQSVSVDFETASGTATPGVDYGVVSGRLTFAPGETSKRILVSAVDDAVYEGNETFFVNLSNPVGGVISDNQSVITIVDNDPPATKFYVVDDASANRTYEYAANGLAVENYTVASGNSAPRGVASNLAGDRVWVVDANRNVYVYDDSGAPLGSWTVSGFNSSAQFTGIATNGMHIWIVDAKTDKVYRFDNAAGRLSGSQGATSSFSLNSGNKDATDIVTDGTSFWVVNNSSTDKVFKYSLGGSLQGSWTITGAGSSPTGITLDPGLAPGAPNRHIWIVDNGTDRVYQFNNAANLPNSTTSKAVDAFFNLNTAAGNTNPQGIADPPAAAHSALHTPNSALAADAALLAVIGELEGWLTTGKKRK